MIQNEITKKWIEGYVKNPASTLLIESPGSYEYGVSIVNTIHNNLIKEKNNPIIELISEKENVISVDDIRILIQRLSLKSNKGEGVQRIVVINKADLLTRQAQNSLLKQSEELPSNTIIILIVLNRSSLIGTLLSRCFLIKVLPITENQSIQFGVDNSIEPQTIKKSYLLSEGNPGLFIDLINHNNEDFLEMIEYAKDYLSKTTFEKQDYSKKLSDKNFNLNDFLISLRVICKTAMRNAKTNASKQLWKNRLSAVLESQQLLQKSVVKKLVILNLSIKL